MGFRFSPTSLVGGARAFAALAAFLLIAEVSAARLQVGPTRPYQWPSEAAAAARSGDIVEIDAGVYEGNVAVWRQDGLTIRGVGGIARIRAHGRAAEGKGIWVIKGRGTTLEFIEFSGARVADQNGAGVRQEGADLIVRNCSFRDNENGVLGGAGDVVIEYSEFSGNGFGDGQSHNIYISERTRRFVLRGSFSHGAKVGHNVKSRARENHILYNWLLDGRRGSPSYSVDLPNGGLGYVIGNVIQQGSEPENATLLSYGAEGARDEGEVGLYIINNTFVNDHSSGVFIRNAGSERPVRIVNNIFAGAGVMIAGAGKAVANWIGRDPGFIDRARGDYRPVRGSPVVDRGVEPGAVRGFSLVPTHEYRHPRALVPRVSVRRIDIGAYEADGPRAH